MSMEGKRAAAGAFILDEAGRLLIVKPTYREGWMIPGGMVEAREAPRVACRRELHEELGLHLVPQHLLVLDYVGPSDRATDMLHFIFDGGVLDSSTAAAIRLDPREHSDFQFAPVDLAHTLLTERLSLRLGRWLARKPGARSIYFETEYPAPHAIREACAPHIRDAAVRPVLVHALGRRVTLPAGVGPRAAASWLPATDTVQSVIHDSLADAVHLHFGPDSGFIAC